MSSVTNRVPRLNVTAVPCMARPAAGPGTSSSSGSAFARMPRCHSAATAPAAASSSSSPAPSAAATATASPIAASERDRTAVRPSRQSACSMMAMTTGLTPWSTPVTSGSDPNRT